MLKGVGLALAPRTVGGLDSSNVSACILEARPILRFYGEASVRLLSLATP